jgi:GcrA cell cycle regulator
MNRKPPAVADSRSAWSEDTVERLKVLWSQDELTASVIARRLGVSRNAVLGKVHRLKLPTRRGRQSVRSAPPPKAKPVRRVRRVRRPMTARTPTMADAAWTGLVSRLERLPSQACHWPLGDPRDADFAFCGRPAAGRIYCDAHWVLGHAPRRPA